MEYSENENPTPRFGCCKDNKTSFEESFIKRIPKYTKDIPQNRKNKERYKNSKIEKRESKNKERSNQKNKSKEKSKNEQNFSKSKKKIITSLSHSIGQKHEKNTFDIFAEKFLFEKELAFQQFQVNEDADYLAN